MAKMYLSEEETCQALGVDMDGLMELVNSRKLQMYQDGARHVYKAGDVEALAGELNPSASSADLVSLTEDSTIGLADDSGPGLDESGTRTDLGKTAPLKKEDTVITAEGISIFDDEDLEIEEADPMAETQIAPSLDDQIALDGVGSGSGLLDLTRESDDTSLGAEVLDHIDMEGSTIGSNIGNIGSTIGTGLSGGLGGTATGSGLSDSGTGTGLESISTAAPTQVQPPTFVEAVDPSSGFFGGLLVGAAVMILIASAAAISALFDTVSGLLAALQNNLVIVLVIMVVVTLVSGVVGLVLGKAFQTRQDALR
ncbi:MAG: hypothetical protein JW849_07530 [Phycisphaerae bacterium]|nr:hypothetical protein [Phycisphaerae bacterium]